MTTIRMYTGPGNWERETDKAFCIDPYGWFPKSICSFTKIDHMSAYIDMPEWFARKRGFMRGFYDSFGRWAYHRMERI